MFTGIVEELGQLLRLDPAGPGPVVMTVRGPRVAAGARPGDSVAVDGVCLTVADATTETFRADVMGETLRRTTLAALVPGAPVNLERAATPSSRLGGHLVQGHVDGVGTVLFRTPAGGWHDLRVSLPDGLSRYVVEKGSITVDGVSLTVVAVTDDWFEVGLIPTTLEQTTLGRRAAGDPVNLEVDVIAKYVEKQLRAVPVPESGRRP
jgi:riboflavin synthase